MKKTCALILAILVLASFTMTAAAASPAEGETWGYDEYLADVLAHAQSIQASVAAIEEAGGTSSGLEMYAQLEPVIEMLNAGRLEFMGMSIDISDPQPVSFAFGPISSEIISREDIEGAALPILRILSTVLEPIDEQLYDDALDSLPVTAETLKERATRYGDDLKVLADDVIAFLKTYDLSPLLTGANMQVIVGLMLDGAAQEDILMALFEMVANTPGLGSEVAIEAGLIGARATALFSRIDALYADASEWYNADPTAASAEMGASFEQFLAGLKSSVEDQGREALGDLLGALTDAIMGR